jgi:D-serine deaminase-like pyridoxal phosphate-dependent protein
MYCGTQQHIASYAEREAAIADRTQYLRSVIEALSQDGSAPALVTGCGTGTHYIDASLGVFNEWQVGSYIFMDRQYAECDLANRPAVPYEYSLFVEATVVSANTPGMATIDSGIKALSTDGGLPVIVSGAPPGATYRFMGDEHGAIVDPSGRHAWSIGDRVRLAVPHCDPTVNLYDAYHVVSGETLIDLWQVSARGRSR